MTTTPWCFPLLGMLAAVNAYAAPPPTLLEISGATRAPARLGDGVVLVIDAQQEYVNGRLPLANVAAALAETHRLLARARAAGTPIVHVQHVGRRGGAVLAEGSPGVAFAPEAEPQAGEPVIRKTLPNAFAGTGLDELLRRYGRKHLILSGYMTHMCVSTTTRAALDYGYDVTVIASACATRELRTADGRTLPAATVHDVALAELADRFACVLPNVASLEP